MDRSSGDVRVWSTGSSFEHFSLIDRQSTFYSLFRIGISLLPCKGIPCGNIVLYLVDKLLVYHVHKQSSPINGFQMDRTLSCFDRKSFFQGDR